MSQIAKFFILVVAPILAILLALLGYETIPSNPLGWFLLLVGVAYTAGIIIVTAIRKERFWETPVNGLVTHEEHSDASFWLINLSMLVVFYTSPLEHLFLSPTLPRQPWIPFSGMTLAFIGGILFVWARRTLKQNYSGHVSVKTGQNLIVSGPYRVIRHPAYGGFLLIALGIAWGYSSLVGLVAILVLLLPALVYRMRLEEKFLNLHFGTTYQQYTQITKRLIPGIW